MLLYEDLASWSRKAKIYYRLASKTACTPRCNHVVYKSCHVTSPPSKLQHYPYVYGRGGEEVKFFWENGIQGEERVVVLPGVTSALSAPLFAQITATQRDVADQVLICTGTGKKGKPPTPPEYVPSRTVVFLMALHRITGLIAELTTPLETEVGEGKMTRTLWPLDTPCAVIERASCPDQRVIRTTLGRVAEAIEQEGSRPPGLLVVGNACEVLREREEGKRWTVEEGFRGLEGLEGMVVGERNEASCSQDSQRQE